MLGEWDYYYGNIEGAMQPRDGALLLIGFKIAVASFICEWWWSEDSLATVSLSWQVNLTAPEVDEMAATFGYIIPIVQSPLTADFSLQWHNTLGVLI